MQQTEYYSKVMPAAKIVESKTGIPAQLVAAWWSWETDFGNNNSSKIGNNHAGIKSNSLGAQYSVGVYAGYKSINDFANDYARILSTLPVYKPVIEAAKKNPNDYASITQALNKSPYSEADYNVNTILQRSKAAGGVPTSDMVFTNDGLLQQAGSLDHEQLLKYAAVGLGVTLIISMVGGQK